MADFSQSGLEHLGLPAMTREALQRGGDPRVLGWLREAVAEGDRINRADSQYDRIEQGDNIEIADLRRCIETNQPLVLNNTTKGLTIELRCDLSDREREVRLFSSHDFHINGHDVGCG